MANVILPQVATVARFAVHGTWQTRPWTNVFHLKYSNQPGDGLTMNAVCQAIHTAYVNAVSTVCTINWVLQAVDGQDLASRTGAVGNYQLVHQGTATASPEAPVSVAICASWTIQDRYRGGHPRTYFAGVLANDYANGYALTTPGHTKWLGVASALLTDFNAINAGASSWQMVCVRYFSQGQLLPVPYVRPVSGQQVHGRIDSMRRRLGKELP